MARRKTQEEVRAEYVEKMGPELGELQYLLWHDVTTLHLQWSEYRELFATKPRRIHLMNETAPRFFGRLEALLWNDVLLHLCRLTDHPGGPGKERVTVLRYKPLVMGRPIQAAVHAAVDSATGATLFARDWRNHLIAHRDFSHAQDPAAKPLTAASRASVETALQAIHDLIQILEGHFCDADVAYEVTRSAEGGAWDLLYHLDGGLEAIRSLETKGTRWHPK